MLGTELTIARVVLSNEIQYSAIFTIVNNCIISAGISSVTKVIAHSEFFCTILLSWESILAP